MSEKITRRSHGSSNRALKKGMPRAKKWNADAAINIILLAAFIVIAVIGACIVSGGVSKGAEMMLNSYNSAFEAERDAAYQSFYQSAFDRAEQKYHVSNTVLISVGNLQETQKLEVLRASDVEFIIESREDNSGNVTAWLEVAGEGVFTIDLQAAEYSIDNGRRYVLVRILEPELENIAITKTTKKFFKDDWADGSYSEGVDLALRQRQEAILRIKQALLSNQYVFENAKKVAISTIQNLVKQFNPDIPDIIVDVEFM